MYTVVTSIARSFTLFTALLVTLVIRVRAVSFRTCGPEELAQCVKTLSFLTDSVSSKSDLETICPDLKQSLSCIHGYSRLCMNLHQRKHFRKLFHGTGVMVHELCNNGTYQEEYLRFAPCMRESNKKEGGPNEECFDRFSMAMSQIQSATTNMQSPPKTVQYQSQYQQTGGQDASSNGKPQNRSETEQIVKYQKRKRETAHKGIKAVCCTFQEYALCSTHTMKKACGQEAANFTRKFLDMMSSTLIETHCSQYTELDCGIRALKKDGFFEEDFYMESYFSKISSASIRMPTFLFTLVVPLLLLFR